MSNMLAVIFIITKKKVVKECKTTKIEKILKEMEK